MLTSESIKYHKIPSEANCIVHSSVRSGPFHGAAFPLHLETVQFSSVAQSCPTLCDPMNCCTPGLPVHHQLPEFYSDPCPSSRWCHPATSSSVVPFSSCPQCLPASGTFPMSQLFASGGQSIGVSASTSVLPMNFQDWSLLGWTGWMSLQSKGLGLVLRQFQGNSFIFSDDR